MPELVRLETWARAVYGDDAPRMDTLRKWIKDGKISPAPEKQGRAWYLSPKARYIPAAGTTKGGRLLARLESYYGSSAQRPPR